MSDATTGTSASGFKTEETPEETIARLVESNLNQFAARDVAIQVLHDVSVNAIQIAYNALLTEFTTAKYEQYRDDIQGGLEAANVYAYETLSGLVDAIRDYKGSTIPEFVGASGNAGESDIDWDDLN